MDITENVGGFAVVYDEFDFEGSQNGQGREPGACSADEALIACLNDCGAVDLIRMSTISGLSPEKLISELRGKAILQDPASFDGEKNWSLTLGWLTLPAYLSGNIAEKYRIALEFNNRFPHCFDENIKALRALLPPKLTAECVHPSLGAVWLPAKIYASFIKQLLKLPSLPDVYYIKELAEWKVKLPANTANSIENRYTYGTADLGAHRIIELTMNARSVKVYDHHYGAGSRTESIVNRQKTLEAQEKQKLIITRFGEWVHADPGRAQTITEYYNDAFVGYAVTPYDGSFLKLPGLAPDITLYPHQLSAIARILLSKGNLLLAHDVGTGKTYEMVVSAHELYRMGLSRKNLIVVPKNVLKATVDAHLRLYPNDNVLAVYAADFTPSRRCETLRRMREEDQVCIYMAYSSFDMIVMSKKFRIDQMQKEIRRLEIRLFNTNNSERRRVLESAVEAKKKALGKFVTEAKDPDWPCFDTLGIETLYVDEAHNYKNIPLSTRTEGIVGMHNTGSKKCREMFDKAHYVKRLIMSTGTPLTNSIADLFVFQSYLQLDELQFRSVDTFDMWINTFGEMETNYEIDITSSSIRPVTRFSAFHNLTELMGMFSNVCDFHHSDGEDLPKYSGPIDVPVPKNIMQTVYIRHLAERTEAIRSHKVKRGEDNLLKITTDGRKCALDIRLVDLEGCGCRISTPDRSSKLNTCANVTAKLYERFPGCCQIIFSDIGTPSSEFNVYDELKLELMMRGIPENEIAYVHDATTERAREKLFERINKGSVRVIIGSTMKLGIGVNVQEKLIALHHLSVPWRPADMVQREGRILRPGNTCEEVFIYRYVTEGTFDSYSWQLLENKQRFISSFLSGVSADRDRGDISDAVLSYAEIKALAIGNPLIKTRVETANRLERTRIAFNQRQRRLMELRSVIEDIPGVISELKAKKSLAEADYGRYLAFRERIPLRERTAFGTDLLEALQDNIMCETERLFDKYQGFDVILPANMLPDKPFVFIRSSNGGSYRVDMGGESPVGCTMRIDRMLEGLSGVAHSIGKRITDERRRRRAAEAELLEGNKYKAELERLAGELARIDKKLEQQEA